MRERSAVLLATLAAAILFIAAMPSTSLTVGTSQPAAVYPAPEPARNPLSGQTSHPPSPQATAPDMTSQRPLPPPAVRAIYLTSWSAATPGRMNRAIDLIKKTELNGIVVDVKDYTGKVLFKTSSPLIKHLGSQEPRLGDLGQLVLRLHQEGIYVIARIAVFQDQHLIKIRPDLAVRDSAGRVWRDRKGLGWVDPASPEVWAYTVEIAREAAKAGVDELNFDYIRFPSDGALAEMRFPVFDERRETKRQVIRQFFAFLAAELRPTGRHLSADLFGLATVKRDDLGIGQVIEDAFLYFDFISPMVYPSHFARGFLRYGNPAAYPYEVVAYSLERAVMRQEQFLDSIAGLTEAVVPEQLPDRALRIANIRPWLQAFDLGAPYPPAVIRREIRAVYDAGLTHGWYLWNPSNRYQPASFEDH